MSANRQLRGPALEHHAPLEPAAVDLLRGRMEAGRLTMRGAQRVRAVALTLADLAGSDGPLGPAEVACALHLRTQDDLLGLPA